MMKKLAVAVATASTLSFANMAHAEEFDTAIGKIDSSMTVTLATDYIWRGQSQTDGAGAIQGSLDFAHESGLYVGAWASNIDSEDFGGSSVEIEPEPVRLHRWRQVRLRPLQLAVHLHRLRLCPALRYRSGSALRSD